MERRICLCATMHGYKVWTCGHTVSRLKETSNLLPDGSYQLPSAAHVFRDYQTSTDDRILPLPAEDDVVDAVKEPVDSCA
jgi:nitronate monooxygenase